MSETRVRSFFLVEALTHLPAFRPSVLVLRYLSYFITAPFPLPFASMQQPPLSVWPLFRVSIYFPPDGRPRVPLAAVEAGRPFRAGRLSRRGRPAACAGDA